MEEEQQHDPVVEQPAGESPAPGAAAGSAATPAEDAAAQRFDDDGGAAAAAADATADGEAPASEGAVDAGQFLLTAEQPATEAQAGAAALKALIEAVVYVLPEPLPAAQIAAALNQPLERVEASLKELMEETARPDRGVFVREVAGGYQTATKPEHHEAIRNFVRNLKQPLKLSTAALETLAVIAYKQPVTAPEILEIRGVQGVGVLKTLLDRKLITTAGRKNVIGKPILYKTTKDFLTQFGLKELAELPTLKEFEEIRRQSFAEDDEVLPQAAPSPAPLLEDAMEDQLEPLGATAPAEAQADPEAAPEPAAGTAATAEPASAAEESGGENDG